MNQRLYKDGWRDGWDSAVRAHSGVVAAAERVAEQHMGVDATNAEISASIVTLASSLNDLKTKLKYTPEFNP